FDAVEGVVALSRGRAGAQVCRDGGGGVGVTGRIDTAGADEGVIAAAPFEDVIPGIAEQCVVEIGALQVLDVGEGIGALAGGRAGAQVGVDRGAGAGEAGPIAAIAAVEGIVVVAAQQGVVAVAADQRVVAGAAVEIVVAVVAIQGVVAAVAVKAVVL